MSVPEPAFARPRLAAGVLFFDGTGRILLVTTTYQDHLNIPGGYVEPGESPLSAARREVREEIGIEPPIGRLLAMDWFTASDEGDKLVFLFDGGVLSAEHRGAIQVDGDEITAYEFHPVEAVAGLTIPSYARRINAAAAARSDGTTKYLEDGADGADGA